MSFSCITLPLAQVQNNDANGQIECDKSGTSHIIHHAQFGEQHIYWQIPDRITDLACPECHAFAGYSCIDTDSSTRVLGWTHVGRGDQLMWRIERG